MDILQFNIHFSTYIDRRHTVKNKNKLNSKIAQQIRRLGTKEDIHVHTFSYTSSLLLPLIQMCPCLYIQVNCQIQIWCHIPFTATANFFSHTVLFFFDIYISLFVLLLGKLLLKGHGNETDFLGVLQKSVPHKSLTLPFEPFRFWLRLRGDIHIRKTIPRYHRYGESPTPRITITESRLLNFFKENSLYRWYGESSTPCTSDTMSRRLRVSPIRRVDDSAYRWVAESTTPRIGDTGSRYSKKKLIWCQFSELLTAKPFKVQFRKK